MAESDNTNRDYAAHEKSYELFVRLTTWSVIIIAAVLVLMALFLV